MTRLVLVHVMLMHFTNLDLVVNVQNNVSDSQVYCAITYSAANRLDLGKVREFLVRGSGIHAELESTAGGSVGW